MNVMKKVFVDIQLLKLYSLLLVAQWLERLYPCLMAQVDSWDVSFRVSYCKGESNQAAAIYPFFVNYRLFHGGCLPSLKIAELANSAQLSLDLG
jgi:hypothetical protein